jgi:hypothetical protein
MPNPQAGGPPHVGCPRLLIQYIRSYPPHLEAVSSILHTVVTGNHVTWNVDKGKLESMKMDKPRME